MVNTDKWSPIIAGFELGSSLILRTVSWNVTVMHTFWPYLHVGFFSKKWGALHRNKNTIFRRSLTYSYILCPNRSPVNEPTNQLTNHLILFCPIHKKRENSVIRKPLENIGLIYDQGNTTTGKTQWEKGQKRNKNPNTIVPIYKISVSCVLSILRTGVDGELELIKFLSVMTGF